MSNGQGRIARGLDEVVTAPSVVTIGNFDGVHRGHLSLLRRTVQAATDAEIRSVAITFDPHPAAVLRPGSEPPSLCGLDERVQRLLDADVELVVILPFTEELSRLTPAAFVERVLLERLRARRVVVGTNFRFGHQARGDVAMLLEAGERHGFDVDAVPIRELDGEPLSSSAIRAALHDGELHWVTRALGRPFSLRGEVVRGDGRGRTIGIPTANVAVPDGQAVPANGVYAGHAGHAGRRWPCVTNIGIRPTFGDHERRTVEAHLIDVEEELDLYGSTLEITLEHRLRGEQRFGSVDELVTQIRADVETARIELRASAE